MKYLITILYLIIYLSLSAADTLIVHSRVDKRLIAYQDSLNRWLDNEKMKKLHVSLLGKAGDLNEYNIVSKVLGYANTDAPNTTDKKNLYTTKEKKIIDVRYELLTCFHSKAGDNSCIYSIVVPKPKVIVIYKYVPKPQPMKVSIPTKSVVIIYTTKDIYGVVEEDSSKRFRVNLDYNFR